jgi:RimJ/RimL family protein N-acetyltransferase
MKKSFLAQIGNNERLVLKILAMDEFSKFVWIGNVSLQSFDWINRSAEFAIVIGNTNFWKKHCGTIASRMMIKHGFEKMNLNRIWTGTASTNVGMNRLAEKLGMTFEGTSYQGVFLEGAYADVYHYGILKETFDAKNEK